MKTIPEKYHAEIEMILSVARKILSEGRDLHTMAFLGKAGCAPIPIPMNMGRKDQSAAMIRGICEATQADHVMIISEAWALDHTKISIEGAKRLGAARESIANHPGRMDVVMITLEAPEGFWIAQPQIKSAGTVREFGDPDFTFSTKAEGRFACFLPPKGRMH